MRLEKGGPVAESPQEVEQNAQRIACSTESLVQDSPDTGPLMQQHAGGSSATARDLHSTATSRNPLDLEYPPSFPATKEPPDAVHVDYTLTASDSQSPSQLPSSGKHAPASPHSSSISELRPLAPEAYGGGLYGHDDGVDKSSASHSSTADSQSADGPPTHAPAAVEPPPSTGDRGLDITGQSYIQ